MDPVVVFSLVMIGLVAVKFRSIKLWDELLELVYTHHRDHWEAHGRPIGVFWRPDDKTVSTLDGMAARRSLHQAWLHEAPDWMADNSPEAVKLAAWRLTHWASWVGIALVGLALVGGQLLT